jgi:hypothetical protein
MSIDDDREQERRAQMKSKWAKARAQAKVRQQPTEATIIGRSLTRKQVASRVQRAASEALADLRRRQQQKRRP